MSYQTKKNIFVILISFSIFFCFYIFPSALPLYNIYNLPFSTDYVSGVGTVTYYDLTSVTNYNGFYVRPTSSTSFSYYPSGSVSVPISSNYVNIGLVWSVYQSSNSPSFILDGFSSNLTAHFSFDFNVSFSSYTDPGLFVPLSLIVTPYRISNPNSFLSLSNNRFSQLDNDTSSVVYTVSHTFPIGSSSYSFSFDFPLIQYQNVPLYVYLSAPINLSSYNLTDTSYTISLNNIVFYTYNGGSGSGSGSSGGDVGSFDDSNIVQGLDDVQQGLNDLENTLTNGQLIDFENDDVLPSQSYEDAEDNIDVAGQDLASFLDYITAALNWFPQMWNTLLDDSGGFNPFFLLTPAAGFLILRSLLGR